MESDFKNTSVFFLLFKHLRCAYLINISYLKYFSFFNIFKKIFFFFCQLIFIIIFFFPRLDLIIILFPRMIQNDANLTLSLFDQR